MGAVLRRQLAEVPAFRALLRSVEAGFYADLPLPHPVLDLGCGDGHFAGVAFAFPLDVGLDPSARALSEARRRRSHRLLLQATGAQLPFADAAFASAVSNSVLEHIPAVEPVLAEVARVLRPGAPFYFCVPGPRWAEMLSIARGLERLGLRGSARAYQRFFQRISRHYHCDGVEVWERRLERAGLRLERAWPYFSARALAALEWGHYLGLPCLLTKALFGRWVIDPTGAYGAVAQRLLRGLAEEPLPDEGAYLFLVAARQDDALDSGEPGR